MMTNVSQIYIHESKIKLYTSSCRNIHVHNDIFFKLQLYWFFKTDHELIMNNLTCLDEMSKNIAY